MGGAANGALWLNLGKADNRPFDEHLWLSTDGGVTWPKRVFPTSAAAPRGALKWLSAVPVMSNDGQTLLIVVEWGDGSGLFRTEDGGQTWHLVHEFDGVMPTFVGQPQSESTWVFATEDGSGTFSSDDGGAHWRTVRGLKTVRFLDQSYSSPDVGWATHSCNRNPNRIFNRGPDPLCDGNTLSSIFLTTTDGGRTWQPAGQ